MRILSRPALSLVAALVAGVAAPPANASDYSNVCRTADGAYEIDDGELRSVDPAGKQTPAIPYTRVRETVLAHETGHCLSEAAKGQTFKYEAKSSALRVAFTDGGQKREVDFICELAADGLPAAYNCDRRVVTAKSDGGKGEARRADATRTSSEPARAAEPRAAAEPAAKASVPGRSWLHNGSVMRLEGTGSERRFVYEAPRAGIRKVGAKPGTLLFEGQLDGQRYAGTAYVFAEGCPPQPYPVTGRLSDGGRRVVMTGKAPRLGPSCNATGTRDDTLVFTWKP